MNASEKEKKCIDYSSAIRETILDESTQAIEQRKIPKAYTPIQFVKLFTGTQSLSTTGKYLRIIAALLLYLPALPLVLLTSILTSRRENQKIEELRQLYRIDHEVSTNKSFEELWSQKGIKTWGLQGLPSRGISEEDQMKCIAVWFEVLYDRDVDQLLDLVNEIEQRTRQSVSDFNESNKGTRYRITPISTVQALPSEIDQAFGNYA